MKTKTFMTLAAAAMMLAACNNENPENQTNGLTPLRLNSSLTAQTRIGTSPSSTVQDTQISNGMEVYAWVDNAFSSTAIYKANKLTADGSGNFAVATDMFYPADGKDVNVCAMHGSFTTLFTAGDVFPVTQECEVLTDQSTPTNIAKSDLIFANRKDIVRTDDAVTLTFYHMLSKVQIALKRGAGAPQLAENDAVKLNDVLLKTDFNPNKLADLSNAGERTAMIGAAKVGSEGNIKMGQQLTTDFLTNPFYNEAILAPQDLSGKTLTIQLEDGGELAYTFPEGTELLSGKKYIYRITLDLTGITVKSTITDWEPMTPVDGSAKMPILD